MASADRERLEQAPCPIGRGTLWFGARIHPGWTVVIGAACRMSGVVPTAPILVASARPDRLAVLG
jgi:hypothetical protein